MNKLIGLEAIRGLAALYVVLHHAQILPNAGIGRILYFGQEAVIVFFLLSGFVIAFSTAGKEISAKDYIKSRAIRIYPIFIASILISYALYNDKQDPDLIKKIIGNLLMLQDVSALKNGVWFDTLFGNSPTWSLAYEWWFYLLFIPLGLKRNVPHWVPASLALIGVISYQIQPNQISLYLGYFYIWWTGASMGAEFKRTGEISFREQRLNLTLLLIVAIAWWIPAIVEIKSQHQFQIGVSPLLQARHHTTALIFSIITTSWGHRFIQSPRKIFALFAKIAPISYALYLTHKPIMGWVSDNLTNNPVQYLAITLLICIPISWFLEKPMQRSISKFISSGRS